MPNLPKSEKPDKPIKKRGCLKIGLIAVVLLLIVLHFTISFIASNVANKKLPTLLQTDAEIGGIDFSLLLGRIGLRDLQIAQPEGFEGDNVVTLDKLVVAVPLVKAVGLNPLEVRKVHLDGLDLNLIVDTNLVLNVTKLGPLPSEEPVEEIPEEEETVAEASEPIPLWLKDVLIENVNLHFKDLERDGWEFHIQDIRLEMENIQVDYDSGEGPALIKADLIFPGGKKDGKLKLLAKVGTITLTKPQQVPPIQLALGLIGFDLDLLEPFLAPSPTVAKTAFGGGAFDFILYLNLQAGEDPATRNISGHFDLTTDSGTKIDNKLGGTLAKPYLPFTTLFADILGNQFGRITQIGGNVAKGGLEVGKAVAETGITAVKGVGKAATGLIGGVFKSAKGIVTLDGDAAMGGLKDATVGTASNLTNTVTNTAGAAADGIGSTAGAVSGSTKSKTWWSKVDARMLAFEERANQWFEENPFPL